MQNPNNFSNEEALELLVAALDGIDGYESENGSEALQRFWNIEKIERARNLVDSQKLHQTG